MRTFSKLVLPTKGRVELSHIIERVTQVLDRMVGIKKILGLVICGRSNYIILVLDELIRGTGIIHIGSWLDISKWEVFNLSLFLKIRAKYSLVISMFV